MVDHMYYKSVDFLVFKPGPISVRRRTFIPGKSQLTWQLTPSTRGWSISVTCPMCGAVNDVSDRPVSEEGYVNVQPNGSLPWNSCFYCTRCRSCTWIYLKGWPKVGCDAKGRPKDPGYWLKRLRIEKLVTPPEKRKRVKFTYNKRRKRKKRKKRRKRLKKA